MVTWSKDELVKSAKKGSDEINAFGYINFTLILNIELSQGSWEDLDYVRLHFNFIHLFGYEQNFNVGHLCGILIKDFLCDFYPEVLVISTAKWPKIFFISSSSSAPK